MFENGCYLRRQKRFKVARKDGGEGKKGSKSSEGRKNSRFSSSGSAGADPISNDVRSAEILMKKEVLDGATSLGNNGTEINGHGHLSSHGVNHHGILSSHHHQSDQQNDCIGGDPLQESKFKDDHHLVLPVATPLPHHTSNKLGYQHDALSSGIGLGGHGSLGDETNVNLHQKYGDVMSSLSSSYNHHRYFPPPPPPPLHPLPGGTPGDTLVGSPNMKDQMQFGAPTANATNPFSINRFLPGNLNLSGDSKHDVSATSAAISAASHYDYSTNVGHFTSHHESMYYPPPLYSVHPAASVHSNHL
jgi:hypothetical protein